MSGQRRRLAGPGRDMQFQGQLYHILVRDHLITEMGNRLYFNLNGRVYELGPVEYALMTGLKFSGIYEPPNFSTIHSLLFTNRRSLNFRDSAAFEKECKKTGGRSLLSLKLAFLYVLYLVVLPRDRNDKNIEMKFIHIVDDLQKQRKRMAYDAHGFVLALQTWAYEFMPDLGRDCARLVKSNVSRFPRILWWKVDEYYHHDHLLSYFAPQFVDRLGIMSPSRQEWQNLMRLGLQEKHLLPPKEYLKPPLKRKCVEPSSANESKKAKVGADVLKDRLRSAGGKEKAVHVDTSVESKSEVAKERVKHSPVEETLSNITLHEIDAQIKELGCRFDVIEGLLRRCKCWMKEDAGKVHLDEDVGFGGDCDWDATAGAEIEREKKGDDDDDEDVNVDMGFVDQLIQEVFVEHDTNDAIRVGNFYDLGEAVTLGEMEPAVTRSSKQLERSEVKQPYQRSLMDENEADEAIEAAKVLKQSARLLATKCVARKLFGTKSGKYDPSEGAYKHIQVKQFEVWQTAASKVQPEPETPLPIISKLRVPVSWFEPIWRRRYRIADEHIDALTNLLLFKYKRSKGQFLSGWAVMDALGTGYLRNGRFEATASNLFEYISGRWPREGGLPWVEASQVIGVANVNKNHWVCYRIDFASQCVTIFDSMRDRDGWATIADQFEHMLHYIPWLCRHFGV
ncbi:hypothetical protein C2S52_017517 [Perilla frutescens var. hirtella]|nr:hypothetical protein C2S52_017517 [Perilla frutescens var. hirtella]